MPSHQPRSTLFPYTTLFRSEQMALGRAGIEMQRAESAEDGRVVVLDAGGDVEEARLEIADEEDQLFTDRKSTRLNSSHGYISYAVFCLKKKKIHVASEREFL